MNRRRCARLIRSSSNLTSLLFLNYAAGDARAGISCGVSLVIVGASVDDDRCAAGLKQGSGTGAECDARIEQRRGAVTIGAHFQIQQITVVLAFRIVLAMLFPRWIEMTACCFEIGTFAFSNCVDVDAVRAGRKLT